MKTLVFLSQAVLCMGAAFAEVIPLEREAWECVNPLGGDFTNGTYVSLHSAAQGFEIAKGVPVSSNAVVEAVFTPGRVDGTGFKTAGVSLFERTGRFWHLALVESPSKYRYFEVSEMRDGRWLAHQDLKLEIDEKHGSWKTGEKYRLRLEMDGKGVDGTVRGEDGRLVFRRRFALKPGAVGCGRPAIKCYSLAGVFSEVRVEHGAAIGRAVCPQTAERRVGDNAPYQNVQFTRGDDGAFELANGLVRLLGRVGDEEVLVDGAGLFSPSIREYARGSMWWSGAAEVADVRGGVGTVRRCLSWAGRQSQDGC